MVNKNFERSVENKLLKLDEQMRELRKRLDRQHAMIVGLESRSQTQFAQEKSRPPTGGKDGGDLPPLDLKFNWKGLRLKKESEDLRFISA